jgi:hypothetical protein
VEFDQIFNLLEGILWISISAILLTRIRRQKENSDLLIVGAIAFFAFGVSDFIEIFTRAWYQPISLLMLKAACVITFVSCLIVYRRSNRRAQQTSDGNAEKPPGVERSP